MILLCVKQRRQHFPRQKLRENQPHRPESFLEGDLNQILVQKWCPTESKVDCKAPLAGEGILERFWGDSEGNGSQVTTPRVRFFGGVREPF